MIRRRGILALSLLLATLPLAAKADEGSRKQVGQYVDLQPVALPIVVDGALVNYVFVYVRLNLAPGADVSRWRAKEPYFRDALVRAGHAAPFTIPRNSEKVDAAKLVATMMRESAAIAGPGVVRSVSLTSQVSSHGPRAPRS